MFSQPFSKQISLSPPKKKNCHYHSLLENYLSTVIFLTPGKKYAFGKNGDTRKEIPPFILYLHENFFCESAYNAKRKAALYFSPSQLLEDKTRYLYHRRIKGRTVDEAYTEEKCTRLLVFCQFYKGLYRKRNVHNSLNF